MPTKGTLKTAADGTEDMIPSDDSVTTRTGDADVLNESGALGASPDRRCKIFTFTEMKLTVGDRLQVQCPLRHGSERIFVKMLGYMEDVSLIVSAPHRNGVRISLLENDILTVRAFSRQSAFAFKSFVIRVCSSPFNYLHLSFPKQVQGTEIRKSTRVRISVPAQVAGRSSKSILIDNISCSGALVLADQSLGNPGEAIKLNFQVELHDVASNLILNAEILTTGVNEDTNMDAKLPYSHGVEFRDLQAQDLLILKSLVYQQMIENPTTVI